ncbi:glycosyltransferase [[Phormidium] sp. ETS-05]|uniref:glycosyltransferase n=1 Tax=[Phormidium] sp. ETS-05 TaxID=222819 RepID=UPI0018EECAC5|nr:glycosyltransferase [[Phormidium] sp. ETS-05]
MPSKNQNKRLCLCVPDLFINFKGGIQNYLYFLDQALRCTNKKITVIVKNSFFDNSDNNFLHISRLDTKLNTEIQDKKNTLFFAIKIVKFALDNLRNSLIIAGHLNFTPLIYWLNRLTGIPYWVNVYGLDAWEVERPILRKAIHAADRIISISGYTRDRLIKEQNIDPKKISILPCTFDEGNFEIAPKPAYLLEKYGLNPEQPIILTVSRLAAMERYKGYDRILEAMPKIRQFLPNAHYMIVGKGDDRPRIEQLIAEKGLEDCVTLAGFVPDEQLCDYYNLCDVFAMPSKLEGFGIVYLEALACGKPVLGGNQDGAIDALCHGELGALVNPDDAEEIAKTLIQILQGDYPNPLMYQPEALRQKVIDTFGFERFKQTLAELMKDSPIGADL